MELKELVPVINDDLERLNEFPIEEELNEAIEKVNRGLDIAIALKDKKDEEDLTAMKVGTMLTFAVLRKLSSGKSLKQFDKQDLFDICNSVIDDAILKDDQSYTEYVFYLYYRYIKASINTFSDIFSESTTNALKALCDELDAKTDALHKEKITEVDYIEDCLWICLEAMTKMISAVLAMKAGTLVGRNVEPLIQAYATYAIEYIRCQLYQDRLALLKEYVNHQYQLDEELSKKYQEFFETYQSEVEQMNDLIAQAFSSNFRNTLMATVDLAITVGVNEHEVLKTMEDVDDFFM